MSGDEDLESKMEVDNTSEKDKASEKLSDGEDESADESSDAMSVNEEELQKAATVLQSKLKKNPYDYNAHVELIKQLQKMGELDMLREAREIMSKYFPLTAELWMSWLKDEINLAASEEERKAVVELFERAIQDYLSVDLWLEYVQFSIGNMGTRDGVNLIRDTFERALTCGGLHVAKGAVLWEAYREFENVMLGMLQTKSEDELTEEQKEELHKQKKRLVKLFQRQLSCPLLNMEKTYEEFNEWLNEDPTRKEGVDMKSIESGFKKAHTKLSKILPFEEQLLSSDNAGKVDYYKAYLGHEKTNGDPARVQCLFERAVADVSLDANLWLDYVEYIDSVLKICTVVIPVFKRAVRNCPWSSPLWVHYLRALERYKKPLEEVKEVMDQALSAGFSSAEDYRNLWMSYLEYMRRRVDNFDQQSREVTELRETFNKACEYLAQYFGLQGDQNCDILQYWARIEAAQCRNLEKFRLLWSDILSQGHDKTASMWLEYIQLESAFGDSKHLKKLFPRALNLTKDWPESIGNAWLNYERDEGTLESYEACLSKYKARMKEVKEQRERLVAKERELNEKKELPKKDKNVGLKQNPKDNWKRKHESEGKWANVAPKSVVTKEGSTPDTQVQHTKEDNQLKMDINYEPPNKKLKQEKDESEHGLTVAHDPSKDERTVFVSNLDYSVGEDILREVFSTLGTLTDLRLVKDFKGQSKGYCYVEFSTHAEAQAALKKDREPIEGRPMFVSKCDTDRYTRQPGFKYSTSVEKNKLFVKGLPLNTTKEDLEKIFQAYGSLKDVRIVTYRNGHSKGLAYIEFHDEAAAAHALIKTDGMTIDDRQISVAISKPPERKQTSSSAIPPPVPVPSLGGGPKEQGPRGRGRTQMSFVPRSLLVSGTSAKPTDNKNASKSTNGESAGSHKALSNADFRQMLLGKK